MTRFALAMLAMTLGGLVLPCSCASPASPNLPCRTPASMTSHLLPGSTITWSINGGPIVTQTLSATDPPVMHLDRSGRCHIVPPVTMIDSTGTASAAPISIECEPVTGSLTATTAPVMPVALKVESYRLDPTALGFDAGTLCPFSESAATTVDVTRAVGGAAPSPAAVTADYARELSVHFAADPASGQPGNSCTPFSAEAVLLLQETAADLVPGTPTLCAPPPLLPENALLAPAPAPSQESHTTLVSDGAVRQ